MESSQSSSKREPYNNTSLIQETTKSSNKQPNLTPNQQEKDEKTKPKVSRRKEIINIRGEINEIETKKTITKVYITKIWFLEKINKIDKPIVRLIKKKGRGLESIKLEMKKEKLQLTLQKYKGL